MKWISSVCGYDLLPELSEVCVIQVAEKPKKKKKKQKESEPAE